MLNSQEQELVLLSKKNMNIGKKFQHAYLIAERHKKFADCMYIYVKPYVTNGTLVYVLLSKNSTFNLSVR